jgi:hypothetical protein
MIENRKAGKKNTRLSCDNINNEKKQHKLTEEV